MGCARHRWRRRGRRRCVDRKGGSGERGGGVHGGQGHRHIRWLRVRANIAQRELLVVVALPARKHGLYFRGGEVDRMRRCRRDSNGGGTEDGARRSGRSGGQRRRRQGVYGRREACNEALEVRDAPDQRRKNPLAEVADGCVGLSCVLHLVVVRVEELDNELIVVTVAANSSTRSLEFSHLGLNCRDKVGYLREFAGEQSNPVMQDCACF
ncbi:hypothetical protein K438DRAFT_1846927, partial [Mycena galopus ATCC 62051]